MKLNFIIFFLAILVSNAFKQENDKLYPILKDNFYGFIDYRGKTIIKPQFHSVGKFSEGLTPVRLEGTYGYIDKEGTFIISPKFDKALPFCNGLAKVFIDGKIYFIDKKGNTVFNHNYKSINDFGNNSFATVITETDKYGVINKNGNLIVDTIFAKISDFKNGIAVVTGLNHNPYIYDTTKKVIYEKGVIDSHGNWKIRFGVYKDIYDFKNGYAFVELIEKPKEKYDINTGIIDQNGKYRFKIPQENYNSYNQNFIFYQDIAIVDIYSVHPDTIDIWSSEFRYDYKGAINPNGKIIFSNPDWVELTPFMFNRAFAKNVKGKWFLINPKGKKVSSQPFDEILFDNSNWQSEPVFQNGIAIVKTESGWGGINRNGEFIVKQKGLNSIKGNYMERIGNIVVFSNPNNNFYSTLFGFWNIENNIFVKPQYQRIDVDGFNDDLISVKKNDKVGYINKKGKLVWEEKNSVSKKQLNIDYMNSASCCASSSKDDKVGTINIFGSSKNRYKPIDAQNTFAPNRLQVFIDTNQKLISKDNYEAFKLYVANTSHETLFFEASDSRLYLKFQAKDIKGAWKDIEYFPGSFCGNSYHTLFLPPNQFWEFTTPIYHGAFKTKIRAKLFCKINTGFINNDIIYSNEIDGSVNSGQFCEIGDYYFGGLMNPYY